MEAVIVILILVGLIVYAMSNSGKSNQQKSRQDFQADFSTNQRDNYEDPFLAVNFNKNNDRHEIFNSPYPFFYAMNDIKFTSSITGSLISTTKTLSKISDEGLQSAIITLIDQDYFRTKLGLPKYLQMVPVEKFIREGILIQPNEANKVELLNSMTMKDLRIKCDEIGIKAARSKSETVDKLIDSDKNLGLNFENYFMINPGVKELYTRFNKYCLEIIDQTIEKNKIIIADINRKLDKEELGESQEVGEFKIQEYGYGSLILFRRNQPLFRIFEYNLNKYAGRSTVTLLKNGILLLNDTKHLGGSIIGLVVLLNENKEELFQIRLKNPDYGGIKDIPDQNFVYCNMKDESIWVLNTETLENKFLENPHNKNIYSLLEEF